MGRAASISWLTVWLAGCIGPSGTAPSSSEEPTAATSALSGPPISAGFEAWYDEIKRAPGKIDAQAAPHLGSRVRWRLNSMGYEGNGGYDPAKPTGPDNWKARMRMFAGSLDPDSDLGQVWGSPYPLILAVLPDHGSGYDEGERSATLMVEGTLWGVSGGELFLRDYTITAASAEHAPAPLKLAGPVKQPETVSDVELERQRDALDVEMIERLASSAPTTAQGELVIITPHGSGATSDGHRFTWIDPRGDQPFPGVRITGPQPSQVSPRNVQWVGALWYDNGHCWYGVELLPTAIGPYASLKWVNLGPDATAQDCSMRIFVQPPGKRKSPRLLDEPIQSIDSFEL